LQLFLHAIEVRTREIHLVDGHHYLHMRRGLGVVNRFGGLRHDAVVGGNHQHNDIGDIRSARAHCCERGMPRRIDKGNLVAIVIDAVGSNVLRNPAGFASRDARLSNRV
jgi:hypothetical protein